MSRFIDEMCSAAGGDAGMTTGEPRAAQRQSWAQIYQQALVGAAYLVERGLRPGQAVAVLAAAPVHVAPLVQAVWLAGGSVTMLHQPTARTNLQKYAGETATVLGVIRARWILVADPFTDFVGMLDGSGITAVTADQIFAGTQALAEPVAVAEQSTALLQLTSGSTATPKAVRISHANLWDNLSAMAERAQLAPGESTMVSWLPLFHDMGMVGFLTLPMTLGIDLVKITPPDFLGSPLVWFELITKYRGTHTAAPNFAYALAARILPRASGLDLSSLTFALNGAEPIDVVAVTAFLAAGAPHGLPSTAMVPAYGMAESTLGVSIHHRGEALEIDTIDAAELEQNQRAVPAASGAEPDAVRAFPTLGPPLRGIEVEVRGEGGVSLGDREVGLLHIRGPAVTDRYLTVDGELPTRDDEGWLDTGDLGYRVGEKVVVCGRVKDVIIMGGRNIYPTDIERLATGVDGVRAGNAIAVRAVASGGRESFAVAVESREAADEDAVARMVKQIQAAITSAMGVRPAQILVLPVGSLPKTPSGKLKRAAAQSFFAG